MAKVKIPIQYRRFAEGQAYFQSREGKVRDIIDELLEKYPDLRPILFDEQQKLRPSVLLFLDKKDIRFLSGVDTLMEEDSVLSIVPAIAGG